MFLCAEKVFWKNVLKANKNNRSIKKLIIFLSIDDLYFAWSFVFQSRA